MKTTQNVCKFYNFTLFLRKNNAGKYEGTEILLCLNFYNEMLKLGLLLLAEPRPANASRRMPSKYRFNAEKYAELKQKGFRLEF